MYSCIIGWFVQTVVFSVGCGFTLKGKWTETMLTDWLRLFTSAKIKKPIKSAGAALNERKLDFLYVYPWCWPTLQETVLAEMNMLLYDITAPMSKSAHCNKDLIYMVIITVVSPHNKTRLAKGIQCFMFPLIITCFFFPSTKLHTWA